MRVDLTRLCGHPPTQPGGVFHLSRVDSVVALENRTERGWRCAVLARRQPGAGPGHLDVAALELIGAATTVTVDPVADADGYAMVWLACVRLLWTSGHVHAVAQCLAERLRPPHDVAVDLDAGAIASLVRVAHVHPTGLDNLLHRLVRLGLLGYMPPNRFTLTIPADTQWSTRIR